MRLSKETALNEKRQRRRQEHKVCQCVKDGAGRGPLKDMEREWSDV